MVANSVPLEILDNIIWRVAHDRSVLLNSCLVGHAWWEAATAVLYSKIELHIGYDWDGTQHRILKEGATTLMDTLALCVYSFAIGVIVTRHQINFHSSSPRLCAKVLTLHMRFDAPAPPSALGSEFLSFGEVNGDQLARNLRNLRSATLVDCLLSRHIIANLATYTRLTNLKLRLSPNPQHWNIDSTSLKKLTWEVPCDIWIATEDGARDCWSSAVHVLEIANTVFPDLVELNIANFPRMASDADPHPFPPRTPSKTQEITLPRLKNFRYQGDVQENERDSILRFLQTIQGSLTTLSMKFGFDALNQNQIEYLPHILSAAPKLKVLEIPSRYPREERWQSHVLPVWSESTRASPTNGIEYFQMWDIGCSFSLEHGRLFSGWDSLKVLKLGAPLFEHDEHDGRPHFDEVAPGLMDFVKDLPQSIEELYVELDNSGVVADDDEDFDPVAELPAEIFQSLLRLRILDINAWIADIDRSTGYIPEKAVVCRRCRNEDDPDNNSKKTVWISRLECIYQEGYASVTESAIDLEGDFQGRDEQEPWLGGGRTWVSQKSTHWAEGKHLLSESDGPEDMPDSDEEEAESEQE
ncbi:hypothetical protein BCR34DRAFT_599214 [Clohesyomyces aquaticus]|uniref:F-box domain-containing protein n=1 Tax=Clohesyomyces aquaticus TaxID=1231657 RepID=A0A1Y1ZW49_9PLEO|nr:hypothetical protein BCR34DRAFT_599214 [Clohesyomyces aquaticus]